MIRAVIDANQFVSALLKPVSNSSEVLKLAREGKLKMVMSPEIIDEIKAVLLYPRLVKRHKLTPEQIDLFMSKLLKVAVIIQSGSKLSIIKDDPSDNKYLECAVAGRADVIISGDKHLTDLKSFQAIRIMKTADFLKTFSA